MDTRKMARGVRLVLEGMGVPLTDPDFRKTPERVAKLYKEMLTPRAQNSAVSFPSIYNSMVVLRHHKVIGLCPHHLLPVEMDVTIGYIPNKKTLGLSKLARIAESVLTVPMKQEEYTERVMAKLYRLCDPKGAGIYVLGVHGCMKFRGVRSNADTVTSLMRNQFLMNSATRAEFLAIVEGRWTSS